MARRHLGVALAFGPLLGLLHCQGDFTANGTEPDADMNMDSGSDADAPANTDALADAPAEGPSSVDSGSGDGDAGMSSGDSSVDATTLGVVFVNAASGSSGSSPLAIKAFDPGSGPNSLLVVGVSVAPNGLAAGLSVTFNGIGLMEAMNALGVAKPNNNPAGYYACTSRMFYLTNPTGTHDIVVSFAGVAQPEYVVAGAVAFSGVDQNTPVQNDTNFTSNGATMAITISTAPGHMTLDNNCNWASMTNILGGQNTTRWNVQDNVNGAGSTYLSMGKTSSTHTWMKNDGYAWVSSGLDIVPSP